MVSDVWGLSRFPAKVILVYLTYFLHDSSAVWITFFFSFYRCFALNIFCTHTFPGISDSGCGLFVHKGIVLLWHSNFISGSLIVPPLPPPPPLIFTMKKPAWETPWIKHDMRSPRELSQRSRLELSLRSLEGVQNRYLSGKRTAGGCCFVSRAECLLAGAQQPLQPHSDSAHCRGKFRLQRISTGPISFWALVDVKFITRYGVYTWPLAGNARERFQERPFLGKWQCAEAAYCAVNQMECK